MNFRNNFNIIIVAPTKKSTANEIQREQLANEMKNVE